MFTCFTTHTCCQNFKELLSLLLIQIYNILFKQTTGFKGFSNIYIKIVFMKKLIFLLLFIVGFSLKSESQVTYPTVTYIKWTLVGTPSWSSPSFYYCVTRSTYPNAQGYYFYDVWFTSNTYTWDYYNNRSQWRYVQMVGCKVMFNGQYTSSGRAIDFSFIQNYSPTALRYITKSTRPTFKIYWNRYYTL